MRITTTGTTLVVGGLALAVLAMGGCDDDDGRVGDAGVDAAPAGPISVALEEIAGGLTHPLAVVAPGDGSGRRFIVDQIGDVRIVTAQGELLPEPFLDVRDKMVPLSAMYDERGLLGLAFHPQYAQNGRFFVYYSAPLRGQAPAEWDHTSRIVELVVSTTDANRADPTERLILEIDQPQGNHNAGMLAFGADGFLYVAVGDGGGANDVGVGHPPLGNGQDVTTLLGSVLRIDIDLGDPYAIPPDNPFVDQEGLDEIFAYGLRNPYRFAFDPGGAGLLVGDAGQDLWEEVSLVTRGGNYGWNIKEGTHCFSPDTPEMSPATCPSTGAAGEPLIDPVIEFANSSTQPDGIGIVVVGGFVYRGQALPALAGEYVFGAFSRSFDSPEGVLLRATPSQGPGLWPHEEVTISSGFPYYLLGFGEDEAGELYVTASEALGPTGTTGRVFRIVAAPGT